jgi:hypothetical protein
MPTVSVGSVRREPRRGVVAISRATNLEAQLVDVKASAPASG